MKKIFLNIVLVLLIVTSVSFAQEAPKVLTPEENVERIVKLAKQTINYESFIFSAASSGGSGFCTGVILSTDENSSTVLTARHCVTEVGDVYVDWVLVKKIIVSNNEDLAILITTEPIQYRLVSKLAKNVAGFASELFATGYPKSQEYLYYGFVLGRTRIGTMARMQPLPGCSGGGLFNEDMELVGIIWGAYKDSMLGIFTPLDKIKIFLEENNINL